jgi:WD40 repeat protein
MARTSSLMSQMAATLLLGFGFQGSLCQRACGDGPLTDALGDPLPPGAIMRLGTVRWRPSGYIECLAFAPNGKRLASWHEEHSTTAALTIWDVPTGRELRRVEIPNLGILAWTWLADGRGISVVRSSEGPYVWEFSDTKLIAPPHKPDTGPRFGEMKKGAGPGPDDEHLACFAVSPDGKYLAAAKSAHPDKERDIILWPLTTQRKVSDLPKPRRLASCPNNCHYLFFTPDGRKLVVFCPSKTTRGTRTEYLVAVFDTAGGKELRRFTVPAPIQQGDRMSYALSNRYLALGLEDEKGTVVLRDLDNGHEKRMATGHKKKAQFSGYGVSALAFTAGGETLITAGRDGAVKTWAASAKELRTIPDAYPGWIETLAVTPDGKRLACGGQDGIIRHWDLTTGTELYVQPAHRSRVIDISVTPDGTTAITSSADSQLRIWDLKSGRQQRPSTWRRRAGRISAWPPMAAPS